MKNKSKQSETSAAAPEAPQDEYEYFRIIAEKYLPRPELDEEEYRRRWDNNDIPATEPKLPANEEAEYFRRIEEFRECRRQAGRKIDPETAEVIWIKGQIFDPYEIDPLLPEEYQCVGSNGFARAPGSDIWVYFADLPDATVDALYKKHNSGRSCEQAGAAPEDDEVPF